MLDNNTVKNVDVLGRFLTSFEDSGDFDFDISFPPPIHDTNIFGVDFPPNNPPTVYADVNDVSIPEDAMSLAISGIVPDELCRSESVDVVNKFVPAVDTGDSIYGQINLNVSVKMTKGAVIATRVTNVRGKFATLITTYEVKFKGSYTVNPDKYDFSPFNQPSALKAIAAAGGNVLQNLAIIPDKFTTIFNGSARVQGKTTIDCSECIRTGDM